MDLFHVIEDGQAIIRQKGGVFRQVKVYRRGSDVFVASGTGFVKLLGMNSTTAPNISVVELDAPGVFIEPRPTSQPQWRAPK